MSSATTESHPAYPELLRIYTAARRDWATNAILRQAAALWGEDERGYCDARLRDATFSWVASTSGIPMSQEHLDRAYEVAAWVMSR
jgi:hypothetical protein